MAPNAARNESPSPSIPDLTSDFEYDDGCYHDGKEEIKQNIKKVVVHWKKVAQKLDSALAEGAQKRLSADTITYNEERPKKRRAKQVASVTPDTFAAMAAITEKAPDDLTSVKSYNLEAKKSDKEGVIQNAPTPAMTGVDEILTRVCAALSGQMYTAKAKEDFDLSIDDRKVEVILFDDNGELAETTPPMAIATTGDTMIIGWRGSSTLMDWVMDFAFAPMASRSWMHTAPCVRAQGGYCALVENYMGKHESFILSQIQSRGIKELLLTGHSLAGGVAQVAHCFIEGERLSPRSPWNACTRAMKSLAVRCISFSAPMTTVNLCRNDKASTKFLQNVGNNMANIIYESDP
jgi:cytochrome oxidase Cu insertion factor (SCO1/SenC/PrrC family)